MPGMRRALRIPPCGADPGTQGGSGAPPGQGSATRTGRTRRPLRLEGPDLVLRDPSFPALSTRRFPVDDFPSPAPCTVPGTCLGRPSAIFRPSGLARRFPPPEAAIRAFRLARPSAGACRRWSPCKGRMRGKAPVGPCARGRGWSPGEDGGGVEGAWPGKDKGLPRLLRNPCATVPSGNPCVPRCRSRKITPFPSGLDVRGVAFGDPRVPRTPLQAVPATGATGRARTRGRRRRRDAPGGFPSRGRLDPRTGRERSRRDDALPDNGNPRH